MRFFINGEYIIDVLVERNYNVRFNSQLFDFCQQLNYEQKMVKQILELIDVDEIEDLELKRFVELMGMV